MTKTDKFKELEMETFDLIAKIVGILTKHDLWDDEDKYTFDDGDRWARFDPSIELDYLTHSMRDKEDKEIY